jgi:hypothetical protein
MARIQEDVYVIKLSTLKKETPTEDTPIPLPVDELEVIVQELVGEAVLVEILKA